MNNIYIVGFMGTGKTTIGKEVARIKDWGFIDLDELIETRQQRKIRDIFATDGEPYFRKIEKELLAEISQCNNMVVSCGGGIVVDQQNIVCMKKTGLMLCLSAKPEVILARTSSNDERPLLNVSKPLDKIKFLLEARRPAYEQAHTVIDTSSLKVEQVVQEVLSFSDLFFSKA